MAINRGIVRDKYRRLPQLYLDKIEQLVHTIRFAISSQLNLSQTRQFFVHHEAVSGQHNYHFVHERVVNTLLAGIGSDQVLLHLLICDGGGTGLCDLSCNAHSLSRGGLYMV